MTEVAKPTTTIKLRPTSPPTYQWLINWTTPDGQVHAIAANAATKQKARQQSKDALQYLKDEGYLEGKER